MGGREGDIKEMGPFLEITCSECFSSMVKTQLSALAVKTVNVSLPCPLGQSLCTVVEWWYR